MDPLSLTAGILTIAGAARSLASGLDKLSSVYSAPALLNALKDEISCLCAVLDQLQHGMTLLGNLQSSTLGEVNRPNQDPRQLLQSILLTAQQKILQLRPTVENCLKDGDPCEEPKVRKRLWLRRQSHIEQLQRELATIRADLIMALTALNFLQSARNAYHAECLGSESFPPETKAADNLDMAITRTEEINKGIFVDSPAALSDSWNTNTDCTHMCNCQCHRLGRFCTPRILRSIVGSIFIDYSGIPILNPKCNNAGCANAKDRSSLRVSYYFPRWLLSRMVSAVMSYNLRDGPELSHLRTPRVRPPNAEVFVVAREGDVERMRQLLTERSASPFDIDVNGYSALFIAVVYVPIHKNPSIIKLLLEAGADPYTPSHFQESPFDAAWSRIFSKTAEPAISRMLASIFNDTTRLKERLLSPIHKKVIEHPEKSDWGSLLPNLHINAVDSNGRTALHWAANRGDYDAVCALIRCGADPSIKISPLGRIGFGPSDEGRTPLHCASQMHDDDPIIIHALLDAGSDVNAKDRDWKTPLFMASYNNNPRCLDALLCRGAEIDVQDEEGFTALLGAITWNNHDSLKVLMRRGANLHKVTEDGWNIWQWAIACADEGTLRILADIPVYYPNSMAYPPIDEKIQKFAIERTQLRGSSASKYYQIDHSWYSALKNMMNKMSMKHETLASLQSVEHKSGHGEQNEDSDSDSGFIDAPEYLPERSAV